MEHIGRREEAEGITMEHTTCQWCGNAIEYEQNSTQHECGLDSDGFEYYAVFVDCPRCGNATCVSYAD